jgi:hypothetical protein
MKVFGRQLTPKLQSQFEINKNKYKNPIVRMLANMADVGFMLLMLALFVGPIVLWILIKLL